MNSACIGAGGLLRKEMREDRKAIEDQANLFVHLARYCLFFSRVCSMLAEGCLANLWSSMVQAVEFILTGSVIRGLICWVKAGTD